MEESSATGENEQAEFENSQQFAEPVKTENESSTFDFADSNWMSDFVLKVEGTRFYVAKNILALASPVFEKMFQSEFKESSTNELELPGKTKNDVLEFLRCIYPGAPASLTRETALSILPLTEEYQVLWLKRRCEKALIKAMDSKTSALELFQVLQQACLYKSKDLYIKCVELVSEKSSAELDEAREEYQVPAEVLLEILGKNIGKLEVKNMELEQLNEKQRKDIEELGNENAMTKEKALIKAMDSKTSALELFQVLQQACLYKSKDLYIKCVELVSEKSSAELDEAREEYQVPAEVLLEILGKNIGKLEVKNMELEQLNEKQRKDIEELGNENAMTKETLEVVQQYVANVCKVSLAKEINTFGVCNWRSEQVVFIVNLKSVPDAVVKEVVLWDIPLKVTASAVESLDIRIENTGMEVICSFSISAILVCRQSTGKNVTVNFSDSFNSWRQTLTITKQLKQVNEINAAQHGFMRHGKIGLIIQLYMSEPNTE